MIAFIEGTIKEVSEIGCTVMLNGIGYFVYIPQRVIETMKVGEKVELYTHQHVREDVLDLYGFKTQDDLEFFEQLLQVTGVGPRLALNILSQFPAEDVKRAIIHGDISLLTSLSGVGKKTAERIVLDLKESIAIVSEGSPVAGGGTKKVTSAIDALVALGYSKPEALDALQGIDSSLELEEQVRQALKHSTTK